MFFHYFITNAHINKNTLNKYFWKTSNWEIKGHTRAQAFEVAKENKEIEFRVKP